MHIETNLLKRRCRDPLKATAHEMSCSAIFQHAQCYKGFAVRSNKLLWRLITVQKRLRKLPVQLIPAWNLERRRTRAMDDAPEFTMTKGNVRTSRHKSQRNGTQKVKPLLSEAKVIMELIRSRAGGGVEAAAEVAADEAEGEDVTDPSKLDPKDEVQEA